PSDEKQKTSGRNCPINVASSVPDSTSHTLTVLSFDPVTRRRPSVAHTHRRMAPRCALILRCSVHSSTFHTMREPLPTPVAKNRPSGECAHDSGQNPC